MSEYSEYVHEHADHYEDQYGRKSQGMVAEINTIFTPNGEVPSDWQPPIQTGVEFESFQRIPRWKRDIVVSEKIDGTNAQVYIPPDDGPILFGSRTRWITPAADNAGFARWGTENQEALRRLGYGRHYGEWWGAGIQRRYGLSDKRFSLFNTGRWGNKGLPEGVPVSLVPVLYIGPLSEDKIEETLSDLRINGSKAAPGFMDPEGIVIFHVASGQLFKKTIKDDDVSKEIAKQREDALRRNNGHVAVA